MYFYGARWYDGSLGRFISADTEIPDQQGVQAWDRYAYTSNNPVRYTDPTGHRNCEEDGYCPIENEEETQDLQTTSDQQIDGEELTNAQKVGKVFTAVLVDFFVLAPIELSLVTLQVGLASGGPLGVIIDVAIAPVELAIADLGLSIAINTYQSIESGHNVEFKWTLIPEAVSILPKPIQNFFHELVPDVIP